ncbi:MAG: SCP-like extracellular [Ruminococcus sp.]|nr:SCP-like extracellular [Ruminococcus sp.]
MKKTNIFAKAVTIITTAIMAVSGNAVSTNASNESSDNTAKAERLVALVNEARTEAGLAPVYAVPYLNELSEDRAEESVNAPLQTKIGGNSFVTIVDYEIAPWSTAGEITASGTETAEETFAQWKESPAQWAAIMNPEFTHIGVGVVYDAESKNGWYWEQLFIAVDVFERPDGDIEGQYLPVECQSETEEQVTGDINNDGIVDAFDYILVCRYINNQVTLDAQQIKNADVLRDGNVGYSDATVLRKYILGEVEAVPVKLF